MTIRLFHQNFSWKWFLQKIYEKFTKLFSWKFREIIFHKKTSRITWYASTWKKKCGGGDFSWCKKRKFGGGKKLRTPSFMYIGVKSPGDWCIFPIDQTIIISKTNLTHGPQWIRKIQNKPKKLMKWNGINFTKNYFSFKIFPLILPDFNHYGKYSKKKI